MARKLVFDRVLFGTVLVLVGLGLVMVYSASVAQAQGRGPVNPFFARQCLAALVGAAGMFAAMHVDYRLLRRPGVAYALLLGVLLLLVAALFAPVLNNSRRWLFVGPFSVQPSELAKIGLICYVAYQIDRKRELLNNYRFLVPTSAVTALVAVLILLGQDLGTAILVTLPIFVMVFLAGLSWRYLAVGASTLVPVLWVSIFRVQYRFERLAAFFNPEHDPLGSGFQALQSLIAIGSGGIWGLGPGGSVQKLYFLPSPHADFIYSIVAEELGMVGALGLLGLFGVLLWRGVEAGLAAPDDYGRFLAWGLSSLLVMQALIHVSVALAMLPTTGVPLPFISHGGSSMVVSMTACGLLLNVSQHG